jgi:hypothetical protein
MEIMSEVLERIDSSCSLMESVEQPTKYFI